MLSALDIGIFRGLGEVLPSGAVMNLKIAALVGFVGVLQAVIIGLALTLFSDFAIQYLPRPAFQVLVFVSALSGPLSSGSLAYFCLAVFLRLRAGDPKTNAG